MTATERRLRLLESRVRPRPPATDREAAWLRSLSVDDLETLDTVLTVRVDGGDESSIPAATLARFDALLSEWQRHCDAWGIGT